MPAELRAEPISDGPQIHLPNLASAGTQSSAISPGDLLDVRIVTGLEDHTPEPTVLQVSKRGEVNLPLVGPVAVNGLEPSDASRAIAAASVERGIYQRPSITLDVRERATHQVTVLGAVESPGAHKLPVGGSDVLSAIAAAGGLTQEAGAEVEVMRQSSRTFLAGDSQQSDASGNIQQVGYEAGQGGGVSQTAWQETNSAPVMQRINLAQAAETPEVQQLLGDRDVVMVRPRKKPVIHVTGLVAKPDQFELPIDQNLHVLDALAMAGGRSSPVADKVFVIRQRDDAGEPAVIQVSISEAKKNGKENLILQSGDLVSVETTVATTVVDTVQEFFRVSLGVTSAAFRL